MKIRELRVGNEAAWIIPAKAYWDIEIHDKCIEEAWTNEDDMKADAHAYIDSLQTNYTSYKSGENVDSLKRALLVIYGYVSMKYGITVGGTPPTIPEIISEDDIKNFYVNWLSDLPSYEDIFTLDPLIPPVPEPEEGEPEPEPEPVTEGIVTKTSSYTDCETIITGGDASDSAGLIATETSLAGNVRPFMINLLYGKPTTTSTGIDIKTYVLENMFLQDVLDEFGFIIPGIND